MNTQTPSLTPFVKNFNELIEKINSELKENNPNFLYINSDTEDSIFNELLVQSLERTINNKKVHFLAIRNISLKTKFRSTGLFDKFVQEIEFLNIPIMFHDIVNERLISYFRNKGYQFLFETKYNIRVDSMYKIPKE